MEARATERVDVLIAGGGVIGAALAWALAERGVSGITVVDLDLAGVYASSELNAGGARATWWQPVNIETCAATLAFFREHAERFDFEACGYLCLYDDPSHLAHARAKLPLQNEWGLGVQLLGAADVAERHPLLDRGLDEIVGATFSPRDGLINPNAVRRFYREGAEARGVRFLNRHYVEGVRTDRVVGEGLPVGGRRVAAVDVFALDLRDPTDEAGVIRDVLTTHTVPREQGGEALRIECDTLVNCLGAWSPVFSAKVGVHDVTEPVRRQISLVDVQVDDPGMAEAVRAAGMVVDASDLYFHPEGAHVLAGYSIPTESPGFDFSYDGRDFFESELWPRLAHRSSAFERCNHVRGWSGLYAVTPDCSGIAGAVQGFTNLFEAHSFTGRGVMQSYGIAVALAEQIDAGRSEIDLRPLGRDRFSDRARWIPEDLHI